MTIPRLDDKYYVDGDRDIKRRMNDAYSESLLINQSYWLEADLDLRLKSGDSSLWGQLYNNMGGVNKNRFNFNRVRKVINMIVGHQRKNRKSMTVVPIESSDQLTADQLSKVLFWATKQDHMLETISTAFEGAVTCGMNLLSVWMDYRRDSVNGDVRLDNVSYNGFLMDPLFRKKDLSDCGYLWRRLWRTPKQLTEIFPDRASDIEIMRPYGRGDGKFNYMFESYNYVPTGRLALDEFWYADTREQVLIEDVVTGDSVEYFGNDEDLESFIALDKNRIKRTVYVPTVRVVYAINGEVFYDGPNPNGHELRPIDRYPFVPVWAYYEPDLPDLKLRIQGVARGLRDAQYLYDRRKIIELDILESQINSGVIYEEDALVDPMDAFQSGQGKGIAVKAGRMGGVIPIQPPQVPPSMMQLSEGLGREIMEISGVNEELLGSADDDKAGVLSMLRQGAGLTTLQGLYDNLDESIKLVGSLIVDNIQSNFREGKISRIINEDPSPQFRQRAFQKFDSEVEEGLNTTTQKQMQFAQMRELNEMGIPLAPEDMIEAAQLQNKSELIENMQKREQAQAEQAQKQEAIQMEVLKAQINDLNSRALANNGLGLERTSRIEENRSLATSREADAIESIAAARLDKVKAVKELQEMDLNQVQKLLDIVNSLSVDSEEAQVESVDDSKGGIEEGLAMLQQVSQ